MTSQQFQQLLAHPDFLSREHAETASPEVVETHISYVILTNRYAYKIKKTVRLPFLDFSTVARRRFYCSEELALNRRLAPNVYLDVLPVKQHQQQLFIGAGAGETIDYALKMRRIDNRLAMDRMLRRGEVEAYHVVELAHRIADFHGAAAVVYPSYTANCFGRLFSPLQQLADYLSRMIGTPYGTIVRRATQSSEQFIKDHLTVLQQRSTWGLVRDVHGDLHSRNIFLTDPPTIFDCLEFDASYRQIDLLNEVAFLCMDLEAHGADELSQLFYREYLLQIEANGLYGVAHRSLLAYFKLYRANVRTKVITLQAKEKSTSDAWSQVKTYLQLMSRYDQALRQSSLPS